MKTIFLGLFILGGGVSFALPISDWAYPPLMCEEIKSVDIPDSSRVFDCR